MVTGCSTPSEVNTFTATAGNEEVDLTWSNGSCFDEIVVIAKETSAVTVTPTGDGTVYTADSTFGSGSDLSTGEYVVYKGTGTSVTVTGLTNGTTYHFEVFARKATTWSSGVTANATPNLTYCTPAPTSGDGDGIINVTMGTIDNDSGEETNYYGDYSTLSTDVIQGTEVTCAITYATGYTYGTKIWIDYNSDGDFEDSGEEVYEGESSSANPTTLNASFTIPSTAPLGQHRLRIGGADSGQLTPCYTGTWASYEDYTINVIPASTDTSVQFTSTSTTVLEDAGTYDLEFSIINEDLINATTFNVVLISGDNTDIDGYTTQTVTFLGGTNTNQTVTITITDDLIEEASETLTFEIQNVAGGNAATVGINAAFDLTISASDSVIPAAGDIIISEIMYNSLNTDDEWIEIYNASGNDITLDSDWELNYGSNSFDFSGTLITAGSYITIALGSNGDGTFNNENPFTPDVSTIATPAATASTDNTNNITNSSATISIVFNPSGDDITIDTVTYDDSTPWPNPADGDGPSLELADLASDNSLGSNWIASDNFGGTPGSGHPVTYTFNGTWSPSNPNGTATANDAIVINSGNATISSDSSINSVTVNPGAALTVSSEVTLTVTEAITLESVSDNYSSLILDGAIEGSINYERHVNGNLGLGDINANGDNDLITPPLSGQTFGAFATANSNLLTNPSDTTEKAFAIFDKTTGDYENYNTTANATTILEAGTGYRATTNDTSTLIFTGTANKEDIDINIEYSGSSYEDWNLIGNPYPSYLDIEAFLTHEVATDIKNIDLLSDTSGIYGYDGDTSDGWNIINLSNASGQLMTPGQGFLIAADADHVDSYNLEFKTSMRTTGSGDDFIAGRDANTLTFFKLKASTTSTNYTTQFYFNTHASQGLDAGYDAKIWGGTAPNFSLFSHLVEDNIGVPIALQTLNLTDLSNVTIPLGVNANQGEQLTFSISEFSLPSTVNVYLEDNVTNTSTLLNTGDYILTPSTALSGMGRFHLQVSNSALSTIDNTLDYLNIYANKADKTIVVAGELATTTKATIYDVQGRRVSSTHLQNNNSLQTIDVSNLNAGIYMIKLTNSAQNKTQKVIIH